MARILIAEDDPGIALGLEDDLRLEGYDVAVVNDGKAAGERARGERFDLILLDVMLPHIDGFEIVRQVRRAGIQTPIMLLTARSSEAEKVMGFDLGADDYVTKPFSPKEVRARVKALLRRGGGSSTPDSFTFGDVEVSFARCEVQRSGQVVELTPTEFQLLSTFVKNRGRVLSRETLLETVWGSGVHITDRVVDTHIANLRKKIEPQPDRPRFLVSLRTIGYRFDA